jgi:HEPN domain-containing protein
MNRWADWWEQASRDREHAEMSLHGGHYDWACFAAQQGGEKAVKALIFAMEGEPWGHLITELLEAVASKSTVPEDVMEAARRLDKHYIPTRYPNGFASGYPGKLYTKGEAETAIADAETIRTYCGSHLPRS